MIEQNEVIEILELLKTNYGETKCYLNHENALELLFATILSAQCTDDRVNIVTKELFLKYKKIEDYASADTKEMENCVHSTGFYHNKAKNIILAAQKIIDDFDAEVPFEIEKLTSLPGVGRKTANVVRSHIFNIPCIVVDTHVKRVSNLIGFTKNTDAVKIEFELMEIIPKDYWSSYNTQIIAHGRKTCIARRPKCDECFLFGHCLFVRK